MTLAEHDNKIGDTKPLAFLCKEGCKQSGHKCSLLVVGPPQTLLFARHLHSHWLDNA